MIRTWEESNECHGHKNRPKEKSCANHVISYKISSKLPCVLVRKDENLTLRKAFCTALPSRYIHTCILLCLWHTYTRDDTRYELDKTNWSPHLSLSRLCFGYNGRVCSSALRDSLCRQCSWRPWLHGGGTGVAKKCRVRRIARTTETGLNEEEKNWRVHVCNLS